MANSITTPNSVTTGTTAAEVAIPTLLSICTNKVAYITFFLTESLLLTNDIGNLCYNNEINSSLYTHCYIIASGCDCETIFRNTIN